MHFFGAVLARQSRQEATRADAIPVMVYDGGRRPCQAPPPPSLNVPSDPYLSEIMTAAAGHEQVGWLPEGCPLMSWKAHDALSPAKPLPLPPSNGLSDDLTCAKLVAAHPPTPPAPPCLRRMGGVMPFDI